MIVSANDGELVARLHFEAEHTNVLVVSVELLNGCLASTEVETMSAKVINPVAPEFPVRIVMFTKLCDTSFLCIHTAPVQPR